MSPDIEPQSNRLIEETSPYLLQHAYNPVDWYPWGPEALERAEREDRLILLSIGYSACHWCHVMERESFEDPGIAALMNEHFVNIKVDREERPDLDEIYMAATLAMNRGQGGWPMTVFLTPRLEPVFAGTYFPPSDLHGRPGFPTILQQVARAWREDRETLKERASEFADRLRRHKAVGSPLAVGEDELRGALEGYKREFDPEYGGFGSAPKFPPAVGLGLLLRLHRRFADPEALDMVRKTLDAMARGGMYDHIGGGFARYSTDRRWLVPHFEKMLYDNALLARAYLEAYQVTGEESLARVASETLDYILREMTLADGGFYSSTDADSEGEEGKFFVWTPEQVAEVLDEPAARAFCAYYDISLAGNWEGRSIPNTPQSVSEVAEELGVTPDALTKTLAEARERIYDARLKRIKPGLDDKILTAWNGLMIAALAEGYRVRHDERYLSAAERAAEFVLGTMTRPDGGLYRTYRAGKAHLPAYLEDYAYLSEGLLDLYEAGGSIRWLREGERLLALAVNDFFDRDTGAFFNTAHDHERLIMRYQDGADGATPAANAVIASALARISYHLDRADLRQIAVSAIKAYGSMIRRFPRGFAKSLCVVDFLLEGPIELALIGPRSSEGLAALRREIAKHYLPNRILAIHDPSTNADVSTLPLLAGKGLVDGRAALYVCRNFACQTPVSEPAAAAAQLAAAEVRGEPRSTIADRLAGRASESGTERYAGRHASVVFKPLGSTALRVSRLGFGGYRVFDKSSEHREALREALQIGVNLIDTSSNYGDGASERLVGSVVRELIATGQLKRDEIIIVTKLGYVQGAALALAEEKESKGTAYPEMVKLQEGLWHCIHPDFLKDQLERSLDRLELETVDVCLLHNPEYFLADASRRGESQTSARAEFRRRLSAAFGSLEEAVTEGRVSAYGVSSNTAVSPASNPDATSLSDLLAAAEDAAGPDHHFRLLQLPLNLLEDGALRERNTGEAGDETVMEVARQRQIAVLANRPLNAFHDGTLIRLADVALEEVDTRFEEQLSRVADLELTFRTEIAPQLKTAPDSLDPGEFFRIAERVQQLDQAEVGYAHTTDVEAQIRFAVHTITAALDQHLSGPLYDRWSEWSASYAGELEDLLRAARQRAAVASRELNSVIGSAIDPLLPAERRSQTLSQKALWIAASAPGVTSVLVGMRSPRYLRDAAAVLTWPDLEDVSGVFRAAESALSRSPR